MGLNRIQEEFSDEAIAKRLGLKSIPINEFSDEAIALRLGLSTVPVSPESTALSGISQDTQLTPAVGAGIKPREVDPLAGILGVVDTIPFISEIPGVRERFEKARRIAPGAFKFGQIGGTLATGVGALAGAKALIRFTPRVISSIAKRAIPLITKNEKAQIILARAGIDVAEGAIADGLFNAIQGELPNAKDLVIFSVVDAVLPTAFKIPGEIVRGTTKAAKFVSKKLKPTKEIIPEAKKIIPGAQTPTKVAPEVQKITSKPVSTGGRVIVPKTVVDDAKVAILDKKGKIVTGRPEQHHSQIHERLFVEERTNIRPGIDDASDITGWEYKGQFISIKDLEKTKGDFRKAFQDKFDKLELQPKPVSMGEAIKLPKVTGISNVPAEIDRQAFKLGTFSTPETQGLKEVLEEARRRELHRDVLQRAEEVIKNPRSMNRFEEAGMNIEKARLKNLYRNESEIIKKAKHGSKEAHDAAVEMERIEGNFDTITDAINLSGSETGRNLQARVGGLDENFDYITVRGRANAALNQSKGKVGKLSKKQEADFQRLTKQLEKRDRELAEALKINNKRSANVLLLKGAKKFEKMTPIQKRQAFDNAFEKAKKLIKDGCIIGG